MDSSNDPSRWISYLERDLLEIEPPHHSADSPAPFWPACSAENENLKADCFNHDIKKRTREECPSGVCGKRDDCLGGSCGKACREKMRRDRLNDRFMELSAILEPDKPPKTDKASILRDAARILGQLRVEAQQLKDANHQLHETIKELKVEKNELRDEKTLLKCEKDKLERQLKSMSLLPGYMAHHPAAMHATYAPQNQQASFVKSNPYPDMPFHTSMSQWMAPATVDISNDHMLRPPVA